ncbi:MAG: SDR family oxidoreductase [Gammaproteobacteria bacterium]
MQAPVVWITGASSGIGAAIARAYAKDGARLVLSARRLGALHETRARCEVLGAAAVLVLPLDLARPETHADAVESVLAEFGRVDVLINNAGISQRSLARETLLEVDRMLMEVNFIGTVSLTKSVLPVMTRQGNGHIAVVTSLVGHIGTPLRSAYAASKHALHGFFDSLRAEIWRDGIAVTLVCPGFIRTDVSMNALAGDGSAHGIMDRGQKNGMDPDECAAKIVRGLRKRKAEVWVGGKEVFAVWIERYCPPLFRYMAKRIDPT